METIAEKKVTFTPFNPVRKGFYRDVDVYYFIDNLFHSLEFAGIIIVKIMHTRNFVGKLDKAEVFTSSKNYNFKLTVLIDKNSLISYQIESLDTTSTTAWEKITSKKDISLEKWNEIEFNSVINLIRTGS